jgi:hypothetical protein
MRDHLKLKSNLSLIAGLCTLCTCLLAPVAAAAATMPQIWLAPLDNLPHPAPQAQGAVDYPDLFASDATWPAKLPQIKVFKIYAYFAGHAPDSELSVLFQFLRDHGIALALEDGPLVPSASCGTGVEGYNGANLVALVAKIQNLGGSLAYLAMDEPMTYGVFYKGTNACRTSIMAVAQQAAASLDALQQVAPNLKVGDIELGMNPTATGNQAWAETLGTWAEDFQAAYGKPLAFMDLDVNWSEDWLPSVETIFPVLQQAGVATGMIYNASWRDTTDQSWTDAVRANFRAMEKSGILPDDAVFQTWKANPTHVLPVNDPLTLTGVTHQFIDSLLNQ